MTGAPPHAIARPGIAYVPEGRGIFPNLIGARESGHGGTAGPGRPARLDVRARARHFPRLAERLHHGGQQLSGGEQQMLTIGRALMTNPDLLILDEATEGLAPLVAREIWAILAAAARNGHGGGHRRQEFRRGLGDRRPHHGAGQGQRGLFRQRGGVAAQSGSTAAPSRHLARAVLIQDPTRLSGLARVRRGGLTSRLFNSRA